MYSVFCIVIFKNVIALTSKWPNFFAPFAILDGYNSNDDHSSHCSQARQTISLPNAANNIGMLHLLIPIGSTNGTLITAPAQKAEMALI